MSREILDVIKILKISEREAKKALISSFVPCQPGALSATWKKRKGYEGNVPKTREIWSLFDMADHRCIKCSSQLKITLGHINSKSTDHRLTNLQVLCADCNRAKKFKGSEISRHGY